MSFDDFVCSTGRGMHGTALLLTGGDHHLAEDLTQATYTKVYVAWNRVSNAADPVAYTRQILTRTYLSHRRLRSSGERPTEVLPESATPGSADVSARLDLLAALGRIPASERVVVVLRYWHDLSVTQTAASLALSEAAVRQRARRALTRLREQVPDLDPDLTSHFDTHREAQEQP